MVPPRNGKGLRLMTGRLFACEVARSKMRVSVIGPVSDEVRSALGSDPETEFKKLPGGLLKPTRYTGNSTWRQFPSPCATTRAALRVAESSDGIAADQVAQAKSDGQPYGRARAVLRIDSTSGRSGASGASRTKDSNLVTMRSSRLIS